MAWLGRFLPGQISTSHGEKLRASVGVFVGILLTGLASAAVCGGSGMAPLLIAPMGASAVLLFGVPASPLAQPWAILGGNLVAALIGVSAAQAIAAPLLAAAVAVSGAFAAMALLRCIHPPSGAVALTAVLGGSHVLALGWGFILVPVALNSVILALVALAYNNATGHSWPHHAHPPAHPHRPEPGLTLAAADLDEVLADYGEALDIGRDDLAVVFYELLARAQRRSETGA